MEGTSRHPNLKKNSLTILLRSQSLSLSLSLVASSPSILSPAHFSLPPPTGPASRSSSLFPRRLLPPLSRPLSQSSRLCSQSIPLPPTPLLRDSTGDRSLRRLPGDPRPSTSDILFLQITSMNTDE